MKFTHVPSLSVGILTVKKVHFFLHGKYVADSQTFENCEGIAEVVADKLHVAISGKSYIVEDFLFQADGKGSFLEIFEVVIGIGFHWERKENQRFKGDLKLLKQTGKCMAINVLSLEDYLESVIASEMSATASEALLKAHAVISRSWLLAQIVKKKAPTTRFHSICETEDELVRWYDREEHEHFDVCADDHCQRYQGITRIGTKKAVEAARATQGEVLLHGKEICDARFSKCCGGVVESFENVWEPISKPYLVPLYDAENESLAGIDLREEQQVSSFIRAAPDAFCNTQDVKVLSEVLNDYDQETQDFYRWSVRYTQEELTDLIRRRSGVDYGKVLELLPIARSPSGRLMRLKIIGENRSRIIGKELEIRKTLSESHLYSSVFVVEREGADFILRGAGWGHGVGLCQIGAAVMGTKGYSYEEILKHYFKEIQLKKIY